MGQKRDKKSFPSERYDCPVAMKTKLFWLLCALAICLPSCGGGDDDDEPIDETAKFGTARFDEDQFE